MPEVRSWFTYNADFLPLGALATQFVAVQMQGDSAFLLTELTGSVKDLDTGEAELASPAILVQITNAGSGRQLMDQATLWGNLIGTAQRPGIIPAPFRFEAQSSVRIELTNMINATKRVRLALRGYKIFPS